MTTTHAAISHTDTTDEVGLSILRRPAHTIASLHGELDIATAPALRERLTTLLRLQMPTPLLVLDLAELSFCDAAGLAILIGTQRRATSQGTTLRLATPNPQITRMLHATGLDRTLSIHPTLTDALTPPHTTTARPPTPQPHPGARKRSVVAGAVR
jgi:anti-sigma B factor antagonist